MNTFLSIFETSGPQIGANMAPSTQNIDYQHTRLALSPNLFTIRVVPYSGPDLICYLGPYPPADITVAEICSIPVTPRNVRYFMYMASPGRPEQANEAGSELGFQLMSEDPSENLPTSMGETEDDGFSDGDGAGDIEGEPEEDHREPTPAVAQEVPKSSPMLGMTESEIRTQQAALASEYSQLARVFSRALERRVSLTLKRLERFERNGGRNGDKDLKFERPPLTKHGKLLAYQVSSIQSNSRHEALNIWRDYYRQKMDLRENLGRHRQKILSQLQADYTRSALARNTDVPVLDWISANLDIVHYLRTQKPLAALEADDAMSDIRVMRKPPVDIDADGKVAKNAADLNDIDYEDAESSSEDSAFAENASRAQENAQRLLSISEQTDNSGLAQLTAAIGSPELKKRKVHKENGLSATSPRDASKIRAQAQPHIGAATPEKLPQQQQRQRKDNISATLGRPQQVKPRQHQQRNSQHQQHHIEPPQAQQRRQPQAQPQTQPQESQQQQQQQQQQIATQSYIPESYRQEVRTREDEKPVLPSLSGGQAYNVIFQSQGRQDTVLNPIELPKSPQAPQVQTQRHVRQRSLSQHSQYPPEPSQQQPQHVQQPVLSQQPPPQPQHPPQDQRMVEVSAQTHQQQAPNSGMQMQIMTSSSPLPPNSMHAPVVPLQQPVPQAPSQQFSHAGSPQNRYSSVLVPAPQGMIPQELSQQGLTPQTLASQGVIAAGYPYYSGYSLVQGYPQFQYAQQQPATMQQQQQQQQQQQSQSPQGYMYGYQNQWQQYMPPGTPQAPAPWQGQYTIWQPHPQ